MSGIRSNSKGTRGSRKVPNFKPPELKLYDEVALVIKMFATAGDIGVIGFKSLVHGDFKGEVSAWRGKGKTRKPTAESQWKCTEILAQILEGNYEHIRDD